MSLRAVFTVFSFAFVLSIAPAATSVVRGPYLQIAAPTSLVVRWRTDIAEGSVVRYGTTRAELNQEAKADGISTEHIVQLSKLEPHTKYFYQVGAGGPEKKAGGEDAAPRGMISTFTTPPIAGPAQPTRVWVLGDSGTKNETQIAVRDVYYKYTGKKPTDLWLMLGDNAYPDGTDADYQKAVFEVYPETLRTSPLWSTLGNHDSHSANSITQSGVYYDVFSLPTRAQAGGLPSGTEAYYSFDYANIHFVCLDSQGTERTADGAMAQWLTADLAATQRDWIIAFFHHPTYTKGTHDSDNEGQLREMRQVFLPILEAGGVDLILTGHSHVFERSFLLDGHYGLSGTFDAKVNVKQTGNGQEKGDGVYLKPRARTAHAGEISIVAGSSGHNSAKPVPLNHPAMFISLNEPGSVVLDIDALRLDFVFLNDKGEKRDEFSLVKQ